MGQQGATLSGERRNSALFLDVWEPVDRLFAPILEREFHDTLRTIAAALDAEPVDWSATRALAKRAGDLQPAPPRTRPPRAWREQLVRGPHRLLLRTQRDEPASADAD